MKEQSPMREVSAMFAGRCRDEDDTDGEEAVRMGEVSSGGRSGICCSLGTVGVWPGVKGEVRVEAGLTVETRIEADLAGDRRTDKG